MCWSSTKKQPDPPPPTPAPAPQPIPSPADTNPLNTADQKRSQIDAVKAGLISTIKTTPSGVTGKGPELSTQAAGGVYSQMYPSATKKTTGS